MVRSVRLAVAEAVALHLRKRYGPDLVGVGVFGSVGRGDDRPGSDIDMLIVTRTAGAEPGTTIRDGVPVTFLRLTREKAREEVTGSRPDLNVALAGWRSLRPLYDPTKLLARLRRRSFRPSPAQFRVAAHRALLLTFEDLGKLRNAIEDDDRDEMREMAIWFTEGAMGALFDLERFVLATGRRAFIEARRFGRVGGAIRRVRYEDHSPAEAARLTETIWSDLVRRATRQGIRLPALVRTNPAEVAHIASRLAVAERFVARVRRREGRNLVAAGLYGSVAAGDDRRHSDIDLLFVLRNPRDYPRITVFEKCLMSVKQATPADVREEVAGAPWNLPEALSGWRSMRILYDPSGLLRRCAARARKPSARSFRLSARENLLEGYEFLGKLRKAARAKDLEETREMAIWFSGSAMFALLCLERRVVATGRRLFAELRTLGSLGRKICELRYTSGGTSGTLRLANAVWGSLLDRARRDGVRLPKGLAPGHSRGSL